MYTALHGMGVSQIKGCVQLFHLTKCLPDQTVQYVGFVQSEMFFDK